MKINDPILALARKNTLKWELAKKASKLDPSLNERRLVDMKPKALATLIASLKKG